MNHIKTKLRCIALGIAAALMTGGCASTSVAPVSSASSAKLSASSKVFIVVPKDGQYGGKIYQGSGATVAEKVRAAFIRHINEADIGPNAETLDALLASSQTKGYQYVIVPVITRWEDRATEWSGIRDKMELVVKVYSVQSPNPTVVSSIIGKSAWATMGGDHPEDLVQAPVGEFVDSLF